MIPTTYEEILQMDIESLWNAITLIQEETDEYDKQILGIKHGMNIKVPIYYIHQGWYDLFPTTKLVTIKGYGKFNITDFMQEIENREKTMRKILIDQLDDDNPLEAR